MARLAVGEEPPQALKCAADQITAAAVTLELTGNGRCGNCRSAGAQLMFSF